MYPKHKGAKGAKPCAGAHLGFPEGRGPKFRKGANQ